MFYKIALFELQNRLRRPVIYLYFFMSLTFTVFAFSTGTLPVGEKEHINSPYLIAFWCAGMTLMMMLVSSSIMGEALYRDIEYNTKDYYLTYPISKAGYFWGRFTGSLICMLLIASSILIGIFIGTKLGPAMGWTDAKNYGPNHLSFYVYPFFTIALPNIFFTCAIFFGLMALMRSVKVIYAGSIILFLAYFLSNYFLRNTNNINVINLADPFVATGVRFAIGNAGFLQKNTHYLPMEGALLWNRILWPGIGVCLLLWTYVRFNFEKFFSGKKDRAGIDAVAVKGTLPLANNITVRFNSSYHNKALIRLTKLELINIFRDNYFWIILSAGMCFLGFVFWMGIEQFGVPDDPRTVVLFDIFNEVFPFFIFFIIMFYTGETLHRDRVTRYALINDALPPPNRVLNGSKLIALLILGSTLCLIPLVAGLIIQTLKGFHDYNFPVYFIHLFIILLPRLLQMVLLCYFLHVLINNKFLAHGAAAVLWVGMFLLNNTGTFDYHLLLYSYTPGFRITDMDRLGHMIIPVNWFNLYWLLAGCLLAIIAALLYYRGVSTSFKERILLIKERFDASTKWITALLLGAFMLVGAYNYYNVNYLNDYLAKWELTQRAAVYEKTLKQYELLPLPKVTAITMQADLYPERQSATVHASIQIVNKNKSIISQLLLDAEDIFAYTLQQDGKQVAYTAPLLYQRGFFNFFRPKNDTSEFRLYQLANPLKPGDTTTFIIDASIKPNGFSNNLYGASLLRNGSFFNGGLPHMGYDEDEELSDAHQREKAGLPPKEEQQDIAQNDREGISTLRSGKESDLLQLKLTVSTSADQTTVAPGILQKQWTTNNRNYFYFEQTQPGMYQPFGIVSAKYAQAKDTVHLDHPINISILYHPSHQNNISRYMEGYKDALRYFNAVYGPYPFQDMRLAETSGYTPREANMTTLATNAEHYGWNAHFTDANQFDYCYFNATRALAQQYWRFQVAPNNTIGSMVIPEGLSLYSALVMASKKYGANNMRRLLQDQMWSYLFIRRRDYNEHPLIRANFWYEWSGKASIALYGLKDLIGEDSINAALREFQQAYAFKSNPPFAGANDLYQYLYKHTPDSLHYFLEDSWQKITLYDNKVNSIQATPTGKPDEYKVDLAIEVNKVWIDGKGNDAPAKNMNDYIDIGVLGNGYNDEHGHWQIRPLHLQKYKLRAGRHHMTIIVKGKPFSAGIDPIGKLMDRQPNDNMKRF